MTLTYDPDKLKLPPYHLIRGERVDAAGVLEIRRLSDRNGRVNGYGTAAESIPA
jgi:hypothetical protein